MTKRIPHILTKPGEIILKALEKAYPLGKEHGDSLSEFFDSFYLLLLAIRDEDDCYYYEMIESDQEMNKIYKTPKAPTRIDYLIRQALIEKLPSKKELRERDEEKEEIKRMNDEDVRGRIMTKIMRARNVRLIKSYEIEGFKYKESLEDLDLYKMESLERIAKRNKKKFTTSEWKRMGM